MKAWFIITMKSRLLKTKDGGALILDKNEIERLREINTEKALYEIGSVIRNSAYDSSKIYAAAYVLLNAGKFNRPPLDSIDDYFRACPESEERTMFIRHALEKCWDGIADIITNVNEDELKAILLFYEPSGIRWGNEATPDSIIKLALALLQIKRGDKVADFGTGHAAFLREAYIAEPEALYTGIEINTTDKEIASIRAELLGENVCIEQGNILDTRKHAKTFDVAFSNYPFGARMSDSMFRKDGDTEKIAENPAFARTASMDWLFNAAVYGSIAGPRRAVCIMTNGSTWNTLDKGARKHFIANGSVEAVIALPDKIFEYTSIATTLIVFSHGNSNVMMVDARDLCEKGRRQNCITEDSVKKIIECCKSETDVSRHVSYSELAENDFVLNPVRYLTNEKTITNGVEFSSIIKNITRGAPLKAADLDEMVSDTPTDTQYLMLGNIQNGIIDEDLPYLRALDKRHEKYCIQDGNLILSKNGAPFKIAVAVIRPGQKLLANGNLYIIALDQEKADPYFVKAFLESDIGEATLRSITVGAVIPNIGVEQLKRIKIPDMPLEKQKEIAMKYQAKVDEVKILRRKTEKALSSLKHLFDEYKED